MTITDAMAPTTVTSRDGTSIAFWSIGEGPPLLLVHGMTSNHTSFDPILPHLASHRTVHALDRRGRGGSGDADAYDLEREFEDLAAVVDHLAELSGSRVELFGHSFGGLCAFGAARLTRNLRRLLLYEGWPVPDPTMLLGPDGAVARVAALLAAGDDEAALASFYREVVGMSDQLLDAFRSSPKWPDRVAAAPTIPREMRAQDRGFLDPAEAADLDVPVLLLVGSDSRDHLTAGVQELERVLPEAHVATLEGQSHLAHLEAPELFAGTVLSFLESAHRMDVASPLGSRTPDP